MEEVDRRRVAAVLAADAEFQVGVGRRPSSLAMRTSRPTPSVSMVSNGLTPKMPSSM